jgi:exopolyphosphatase/guanosine-5'-triphosphate,3'-diphosphate pyrophosphatase
MADARKTRDTTGVTAQEEAGRFMQLLEPEPAHVLQVARLAGELFDGLAALHGFGPRERVLLECAARLHDIGWSVAPAGKSHHKESARLIRERSWQNLDPAEVELVAQIARYHRKALPAADHAEFARLDAKERGLVEGLAAILRLADGLDRSHLQRVRAIRCAVRPETVIISLVASVPLDGEIEAAARKADLAERVWGRRIAFDQVIEPRGAGR